jgi:ribosomal RNA-processing protein 8
MIYQELNSDLKPESVIADMGCGDAVLAQKLSPLGHTVHSFDLVEKLPYVKSADMANVPLQSDSCDSVVYSLSLMNTNWGEAVAEGVRILKKGYLSGYLDDLVYSGKRSNSSSCFVYSVAS